jgi:hypothetical protein
VKRGEEKVSELSRKKFSKHQKTYRKAGSGFISEGYYEIGSRIRAARIKLLDSNFRKAAYKLGISEHILLEIEQGRYRALPDQIAMLCNQLHLDKDVLKIYCGECPVGGAGACENSLLERIDGGVESLGLLEPSCQIIGQYVYQTIEGMDNEKGLSNTHLETVTEALLVIENLRSQLQRLQLKISIRLQKQKPRLHLVGRLGEKQKTACQAVS